MATATASDALKIEAIRAIGELNADTAADRLLPEWDKASPATRRAMAEMMAGDPIRVPASLRHCVWFKYKIEQYQESGHGRERRRDWVVVEHGTSDSLFNLTDTSGTCAVDPEGAEVHASQRDVWYGQSRVPGSFHAASDNLVSRWFSGLGKTYRYTEHLIRPGDALYVIGQFTTHGGAHSAPLTHDGSG